jgi:hypothetical protein
MKSELASYLDSWKLYTADKRQLKDIGEEQKEEDEADSKHIHKEAEYDASVIEAPARLHAADGIEGAEEGEHRGDDEQQGGASVGKAGEGEDAAKKLPRTSRLPRTSERRRRLKTAKDEMGRDKGLKDNLLVPCPVIGLRQGVCRGSACGRGLR